MKKNHFRGLVFASVMMAGLAFIPANRVDAASISKPAVTEGKSGNYYQSAVLKIKKLKGYSYYYTLNGKNPTNKSKKFNKSLKVKKNCTVKLVAYKGKKKSSVTTVKYNILKTPVSINKPAGTYFNNQKVKVLVANGYRATVSTGGKFVKCKNNKALTIKGNKTVYLRAYKGKSKRFKTYKFKYRTLKNSGITVSLPSGTYDKGQSLVVKCTPGLALSYSDDGGAHWTGLKSGLTVRLRRSGKYVFKTKDKAGKEKKVTYTYNLRGEQGSGNQGGNTQGTTASSNGTTASKPATTTASKPTTTTANKPSTTTSSNKPSTTTAQDKPTQPTDPSGVTYKGDIIELKYEMIPGGDKYLEVVPGYDGNMANLNYWLEHYSGVTTMKDVDNAINEAGVKSSDSDAVKARKIYVWMGKNFEYSFDSDSSKVFDDYKGVCQGLAYWYNVFMNRLGVVCRCEADSIANHEWNVVQIDGKWYNVDVSRECKYGNGRCDALLYSDESEAEKRSFVVCNSNDYYHGAKVEAYSSVTSVVNNLDNIIGEVGIVGYKSFSVAGGTLKEFQTLNKSLSTKGKENNFKNVSSTIGDTEYYYLYSTLE